MQNVPRLGQPIHSTTDLNVEKFRDMIEDDPNCPYAKLEEALG